VHDSDHNEIASLCGLSGAATVSDVVHAEIASLCGLSVLVPVMTATVSNVLSLGIHGRRPLFPVHVKQVISWMRAAASIGDSAAPTVSTQRQHGGPPH